MTDFIPLNNYQPYSINTTNFVPFQPNIIKNIKINASNPSIDHSKVFDILEDSDFTLLNNIGFETINERITFNQYTRSMIFNNQDGKNISLNPTNGDNTLMSKVKQLNLNPYNRNRLSRNIYRGLPERFLIYNSCYPIVYNKESGNISCSKGSNGINVRIYGLLEDCYENFNNYKNFNETRDLYFYKYIKDNILLKNICPHFLFIHGYFISTDSNIDFYKLEEKKKNSTIIDSNYLLVDSKNKEIKNENLMNNLNTYNRLNTNYFIEPVINTNNFKKNIQTEETFIINNPNIYIGKTLIIITESPSKKLLDWASKIYIDTENINVKKMVNSGFYKEDIWITILFQILVSLYVLIKNKIIINNFSIDNNVFIKNINIEGKKIRNKFYNSPPVTTLWKYIINKQEFLIPNYGYVVIVDSNYKDLEQTKEFKIVGGFLDDNNIDFNKLSENMLLSCLDVNIFGQEFIKGGGVRPQEKILDLMNKIKIDILNNYNKNNIKALEDIFIKYFNKYINQKIGNDLDDNDLNYINKDENVKLENGKLYIHEYEREKYKYISVIDVDINNNVCRILTRDDDNNLIIKETIIDNFYNYTLSNYPDIIRNREFLPIDEILDTYYVS